MEQTNNNFFSKYKMPIIIGGIVLVLSLVLVFSLNTINTTIEENTKDDFLAADQLVYTNYDGNQTDVSLKDMKSNNGFTFYNQNNPGKTITMSYKNKPTVCYDVYSISFFIEVPVDTTVRLELSIWDDIKKYTYDLKANTPYFIQINETINFYESKMKLIYFVFDNTECNYTKISKLKYESKFIANVIG